MQPVASRFLKYASIMLSQCGTVYGKILGIKNECKKRSVFIRQIAFWSQGLLLSTNKLLSEACGDYYDRLKGE